MKNRIIKYSYGKQNLNQKDINAVINVLKSDWLTQGPKIQEFEIEISNKFGSKYTSVVSNGTAALHLTGLALGWKKNDIIITSPITFLASANCVVYSSATPDFVDINSSYYTIDLSKLEEKLKKYISKRKKIKAVVAVDFAGQPCDWKGLRYLADKYEFQLVNDNCHALGAKYFGDEKYAIKYADVVCQSYHPVKHITTGEGGAILTNDISIDKKIKILRTHGMVKDSLSNQGSWFYEMQYLGFNYRITDFQCAMGISQLKKLELFVKNRRIVANYYNKFFRNDERFVIPKEKENNEHSYHLYPLQIRFDKIKTNKIETFAKLSKTGINCQVHYIPIHLQPFYRKNFGFKKGDFPEAEKFYDREISIPMYSSLSKADLNFISKKILNVIV